MVVKYKDYKYYYILVIGLIAIVLSYVYLFQLVKSTDTGKGRIVVIGNSMNPTFQDGDEIKYTPSFEREEITNGTIIIFSNPDDPRTFSIKRVVGTEGSLVEIKDNIVYLDKEEIKFDNNDNNSTYYIHDMSKYVGEDEVFVLGDNYNDSKDSRNYGSIPIASIKGIVKE